MKKIVLILVCVLAFKTAQAQVALSYYPFESVLGLSTDVEKALWADLRLDLNTFIGVMNSEAQLMWNWRQGDWVNYYSGLGINFKPFYAAADLAFLNAYILSTGARIKPWQAQPNFQIIFELSPYFYESWDGAIVRANLGVAYNF